MNKDKDYIFYRKNNKLYGGGFEISSILAKHNISIDPKSLLSIPSSLYYNKQSGGSGDFVHSEKNNDFNSKSLYDHLIEQFIYKTKNKSMKRRRKNRKKTRKKL